MNQTKYIHVGQLNKKLFYKLGIKLITEEVVFTYEILNHIETKRVQLYKEIKKFYQMQYIIQIIYIKIGTIEKKH